MRESATPDMLALSPLKRCTTMSVLTYGRNGDTAGKDVANGCSRRRFLAGLAAIGAAACSSNRSGGDSAAAPQPSQLPTVQGGRRIDVHHHYGPPGWVKILS